MNLRKQLQPIVDRAADFGISPIVMERAIVPSLVRLAKFLKQSQYCVWENQERRLVATVLGNRIKPDITKKVILAFPSAAIAASHPDFDPQTMVLVDADVTHLIFQTLAIPEGELDSLIFFNKKGNGLEVREITCQEIRELIQDKLKKLPIPPEEPHPDTRLV